MEGDCVVEDVLEGVPVVEGVCVLVCDRVCVPVGLDVLVAVCVTEPVWERVPVLEGVPVVVTERVCVPVAVIDGVWVGVFDLVPVVDDVFVGDTV